MIRVKATKLGFYDGKRVLPGSVFAIAEDSHFSKKWMEKMGGESAPEKSEGGSKPAPKAKPKGKVKGKGKKAI